jgi:hypothetical protein
MKGGAIGAVSEDGGGGRDKAKEDASKKPAGLSQYGILSLGLNKDKILRQIFPALDKKSLFYRDAYRSMSPSNHGG